MNTLGNTTNYRSRYDFARWKADADALVARREREEWGAFWRLFFD